MPVSGQCQMLRPLARPVLRLVGAGTDMRAAPPLPTYRLERDGQMPEDLFWAWREQMGALFDVALPHPAAVSRFEAALSAHHLGTCLVLRGSASAARLRRSPTGIARAGVDHLVVTLRERGMLVGEADGRAVRAGPGDICLLDLSRPMQGASPAATAEITLVLPRSTLPPGLRDEPALHGLVLPGAAPLCTLLADHLRALLSIASRLCASEAWSVAAVSAGLLAACIGCQPDGLGVAGAAGSAAATLLAIRRHIEANLRDPALGADSLTLRFGLSRSSLYRMFGALGGVSGYIRRRRLAHAYRALAASPARGGPRITELAQTWLFESDAAFSRAFRQEHGLSPSDVRAAAAGRSSQAEPGVKPDADLPRWVRDLAA